MSTRKNGLILLGAFWLLAGGHAWATEVPQTPRIDSVVPSQPQPHATDPAVIWCDDFDGPQKPYTESEGGLDNKENTGHEHRSAPWAQAMSSRQHGKWRLRPMRKDAT